jgi:soluble lytic murein transglycosylase-like protein
MTLLRAREGLPLDLFVETFPFSETANYVRTVLVSVHSYEAAYLGEGRLPDLTRNVRIPSVEPPDF